MELLNFEFALLSNRNDNLPNPEAFNQYLQAQHPRLIHTFAVKKCNISVRTRDIERCIYAIYNYYMETQSVIYHNSIDRQAYRNSLQYDLLVINAEIHRQQRNRNQNRNYETDIIPSYEIQWPSDGIEYLVNTAIEYDQHDWLFDWNTLYNNINTNNSNNKFQIERCFDITEKDQCEIMDCPICLEEISMNDMVTLQCNHNHTFCSNCILNQLNKVQTIPKCALCRQDMKQFIIRSTEVEHKLETKIH